MDDLKNIFFSVNLLADNIQDICGRVIGDSSGNFFSGGIFDRDDAASAESTFAGDDADRQQAFAVEQGTNCAAVGGNAAFNGAAIGDPAVSML